MTDIEQKALALAIEARVDDRYRLCPDPTLTFGLWEALCRAIERHEAFRQEVSDTVEAYLNPNNRIYSRTLHKFIISKPDPLVEVLNEISHEGGYDNFNHYAHRLRAALEARGLEIREKNDD